MLVWFPYQCPECGSKKFNYVNRILMVNSDNTLTVIFSCRDRQYHTKPHSYRIKTDFKFQNDFKAIKERTIDSPLYHYCPHCNKTYFNLLIQIYYNYVSNKIIVTHCCPQCKERTKYIIDNPEDFNGVTQASSRLKRILKMYPNTQ